MGTRSDAEMQMELLSVVEEHIVAEANMLEQYRDIATNSPDPIVALLMEMVLEDEERHHLLFRRIATSLPISAVLPAVYARHGYAEKLPRSQPVGVREPAANRVFEGFAREERASVKALTELSHKQAPRDSLVSVLLGMMAADSRKHEQVMRYLAKRQRDSMDQGSRTVRKRRK